MDFLYMGPRNFLISSVVFCFLAWGTSGWWLSGGQEQAEAVPLVSKVVVVEGVKLTYQTPELGKLRGNFQNGNDFPVVVELVQYCFRGPVMVCWAGKIGAGVEGAMIEVSCEASSSPLGFRVYDRRDGMVGAILLK